MSSVKERILTYITTQMAGAVGVSGRVYRSRPEAVRKESLPCILINHERSSADPTYTNLSAINWTMQVQITIMNRGLVPDSASDPTFVSVYKLMMANRTLGGLCMDVLPLDDVTEVLPGDYPTLIETLTFACIYRTSATDPEV